MLKIFESKTPDVLPDFRPNMEDTSVELTRENILDALVECVKVLDEANCCSEERFIIVENEETAQHIANVHGAAVNFMGRVLEPDMEEHKRLWEEHRVWMESLEEEWEK